MAVVAAYLYRDGARVRSVAIDEKVDCAENKSEFVWIGIADPTAQEMRALQDCYDLHPLAVEDALHEIEVLMHFPFLNGADARSKPYAIAPKRISVSDAVRVGVGGRVTYA